MRKKLISCLLICSMLLMQIPTPVAAAASYGKHFDSSGTAILKQAYGDELDGIGQHAAILTKDQDNTFAGNVSSALLVDLTDQKVLASEHALDRVYPASTTKVLTALLTLEHCKLTETVTVKEDIKFDENGVVAVGFKKGDKVKVEGLLNALLIESANDCAVVLAEHIAGSVEKFADMMNERAKELGATHCHFVTTNGLHNNNHYITAYDMYLIFKEAIKYDAFLNIVQKANYTLDYENASGVPMSIPMDTTNHYILGDYNLPSNIFMIGGKTGTTSQAGSCLVILTKDSKGKQYISLVFHGETKDVLYNTMSNLLEKTNK